MVEVTVTGADGAAAFVEVFGKGIPAATARALNRAIRTGRTLARRGITKETGLQAKYITPALLIQRARPERTDLLSAAMKAKTRRIPLIAYFLTGFKSGLGIGGRTYSVGAAPPRAFFARFKSGKRVVAERVGRKRGELRVLMGPPIPVVVAERHIFEALRGPVAEEYRKRYLHEVTRLLERRTAESGADD